ncbi:MAG: hypothetical protein ACJ747_04340 [Gaiellaceae bacterium]
MRAARAALAATVAAVAVAAVGAGCGSGHGAGRGSGHGAGALHFASGTNANQKLALSLGFNLVDVTGSQTDPAATKATVDALPDGVQALIWVGNLDNTDCTTPGYETPRFRSLVNALAHDGKVYGYYLSDEPHPLMCTNAAADIRARADYVHARSDSQKAFIVVQDGSGPCGARLGCEFRALRPAKTHVDVVGLDPYPCHYDEAGNAVPCAYDLIGERVAAAVANGVPLRAIAPLYQEFGQEARVGGPMYYRTPKPAELSRMLDTWGTLVPHAPFDFAYTFGVQCSNTCPAPQAIENRPDLQRLVRAHNR